MKQNRRQFLGQAAGSAGAFLTGRSVLGGEPAPRPFPGTIIDTHTHFYDPTRPQGVPWPSKNEKQLFRTVLPQHYRALPVPHPVTGTVVVEASAWIEDNQWILDLAAHDPFIVGLVGNLPVGTDEFAGHLKRFVANRLFRGIRLGGGRLKEAFSQPRCLADLRLLAANDLALDLLGGPDILTDAARLAREIPDLRIVIDHVANVRIDGRAAPADWREGLRLVGRCQNVFCKVSGLVEGTGRTDGTAPRDTEYYRPILDEVWNVFGAERLIYGSNWPVSERFATLATVQAIAEDSFKSRGTEVLGRVFSGNAQAAYRWVQR